MKWVKIKDIHANADNLDSFWWDDGELYLLFNSDPKSVTWEDPDRALYLKLCHQLEINVDLVDLLYS